MDHNQTIPQSVQSLISAYGSYVGIDGLQFDAEGHIGLDLDGIEVDVAWVDAAAGLVLRSMVSGPSDPTDAKFLVALHVANAEAAVNGMGVVTLDTGFGAWVWVDRVEPTGLSGAGLHERLSRAAKHVAFWTEQLPKLADDSQQSVAQALHDFPMIRQILESKAKFGVVGSDKEETVKARSNVLSGIAWIASKFSSKAADANKQAKLNLMTAISKQFNLDLDSVKTLYGKAIEIDKGTPLKLSVAKAIVNHSILMQSEGKDRVVWNRDAMSTVTNDKRNVEMTKSDEKLEATGEGTLKNNIISIADNKKL
eukprot:gene32029-36778_t